MQTMRSRRGVKAFSLKIAVSLAIAPWLSGCGRAPSFNILGSFFPAWLVCIVAGILLTAGCYGLFVRLQLQSEIRPGIVVYPCLALFWAFTLWLIFFT